MKKLVKIIPLVACSCIVFLSFLLIDPAAARPQILSDPCALDPNNIFNNGTFAPGYQSTYGEIATGWTPFVFSGISPTFDVVDNEKIDPQYSQQIFRVGTFDAGVQQTINNLTPGTNYWYRLGYALAAKVVGTENTRVQTIGRQIGVDPTGGMDVHSGNILWGSVFWDGNPAVNIPALTMVFKAQGTSATIYFRAIATDGTGGENRVWFDAACGEPRNDLPTSTPVPGNATPSGTRVFLPLIQSYSCTPSVLTSLNVGTHPKGIAVDDTTNRIYTALFDSSSVNIIDGNTNSSLGTFSLNDSGHGNGVGVANGRVFSSLRDTSTVSVLNAATGAFNVTRTVGSLPYGVGAAGTRAWVANYGSDSVTLLDTTTNNIVATATFGAGTSPALVAASSNRAFVSLWGTGVADIATDGAVSHNYPLGSGSYGVAYNSGANRLFVSNRNNNQVAIVDPDTGSVLKSITLAQIPYALAVNPNTNRLFIVLAEVNQVNVRDATTLNNITTLSIGTQGNDGGDSIGVMNNRVYVANNGAGTLTVIKDYCP